jgi:hypothetical protein
MTATAVADLLRSYQSPPVRLRTRAAAGARAVLANFNRSRLDIGLLGTVLAAATVVHMRSMYVTPARFDDEGTYVAQAWAIEHGKGLAHYTYWYDHPPLGWIQLAIVDWFVRPFANAPNAIGDARVGMLLFKWALCIALYVLARRLGMRRVVAAGAVALLALSPLGVVHQRMVFLDNIEAFWIIAAFAVAARRRLSIAGACASGVLFAVGVLSKETGALIFPALAVLVWQRLDPQIRRFGAVLFPLTVGLVVATYPLLAILRNELIPGDGHVSLWEGIEFQLWGRDPNGPLWDATSAAHGHAVNWLALDPFLLAAGAFTVLPALFVPRLRAVAIALAIQLLTPLRGGYLPGPYVIMILPFAALVVAGLVETVFDRVTRLEPAFGRRVFREGRPSRFRGLDLSWPRRVAAVVLILGATAGAVAVGRDWSTEYEDRLFDPKDMGMTQAQEWIEENVPRDATLVVDDSIWVDLVDAGFQRERVIWFWKVDLDPAIEFEDGWRSVDYAVLGSTYSICDHHVCLPTVLDIIDHSEVVGTFGDGIDRMTVYRVQK